MKFPTKEEVQNFRETYPVGRHVELIGIGVDPYSKLKLGNQGTVNHVDDTRTIFVSWDCGSGLGMLYDEDCILLAGEGDVQQFSNFLVTQLDRIGQEPDAVVHIAEFQECVDQALVLNGNRAAMDIERVWTHRPVFRTLHTVEAGFGQSGKIAPNLLKRDFHAEKPNQKWVTDVTEFSLFGEKLYLSPILDLYSSDLVSYTISDRPVLSMVTSMLDRAFQILPDGTGLILHSDQGWQYQHKNCQAMLREKGIRQSMSRKVNCLDNAVIENFFGLLKSELLYLQEFHSLEHFKCELIEYLDYYNNRRIKVKLKGLPPAIHRQQDLLTA